MSSQCSMRTSHKMRKEHWLFPSSLLDATKTTILKIGKPNYRFSENRIRLPLQKKFLDKAKHPWSSSAERLRGSKLMQIFHFDLTHSSPIILSRLKGIL